MRSERSSSTSPQTAAAPESTGTDPTGPPGGGGGRGVCICTQCVCGEKRGCVSVCVVEEVYLSERLRHLAQEVFGELDRLVYGQVQAAICQVLLNPPGQLPTLVSPRIALEPQGEEDGDHVRPPQTKVGHYWVSSTLL